MPAVHELRNFQHGFDVPVGQIGTTCRLGDKWTSAQPGDHVTLFECDVPQPPDVKLLVDGKVREGSHYRGYGVVLGWHRCTFRKLPESLLALEHENECKTWAGLLHAMERAYPGLDGRPKFTPDSEVTMLIYLRQGDGSQTPTL